MFQKFQYRLLSSYLGVLASILGVFAVAVRLVFAHSLSQQVTDKLTVLTQSVADSAEFKRGKLEIGDDFSAKSLLDREHAIQWFDTRGHLITQQGRAILSLPFSADRTVQFQAGKPRIQAVTLPIWGSDNQRLIGYVRTSQSLEEFDATLQKLDLGLAGGILMSLLLSGVGGVILTRQAMQPIKESFERLKQFTADASHELRSPLMAIKSNVSVALKYPEGMRLTDVEKFEAIASATNQMTRLTEDLLFLARTDKVVSRNWDTVNLASVLHNLVQLHQSQAETKQIHFTIQLIELHLLGDSVQLTRLFANLIENALHYTPSGGVVEIKTKCINSYFYVTVQDTGVGIALEHIERVFERFWRADQSRSYWSGGAGLGLAIAQAIAQNHGGFITVASQLGAGSCFTVCLPANAKSTTPTNSVAEKSNH